MQKTEQETCGNQQLQRKKSFTLTNLQQEIDTVRGNHPRTVPGDPEE
jgi:hypothetical protein